MPRGAKPKATAGKKPRGSAKKMKSRAMNAFDTAVDDEWYIKGTRQQQDIDLDHIADEKIRELVNGEVKSDDDEEMDSDEAFGSSQSEMDINLNEESDWGDSFDESELVPLSEVWDIDDREQREYGDASGGSADQVPAKSQTTKTADVSDSVSVSDTSDSEASESEAESNDFSEDSSDDDGDSDALNKAIKSFSNADTRDNNKLAKFSAPENPFNVPTSGEKLSLQELGGTVDADLKLLKSKTLSKPLNIPLPQRVQQRSDRSAAYSLTKDEISKWEDTVKANRRAESLSFPINAPPQRETVSPFTPAPVESQNDLESKVRSLLEQSALTDERAVSAFEEMAPSNLSLEEVKQRRQQLRYMRELMFREEKKAKRIKKIKSKSYRKVHKKDREREEALMREAGEEESSDSEQQDRRRALERASLRHKSNSKWAKRIVEHGMSKDATTRAEMEEMLKRGDSLKKKIMGHENSDGSDEETIEFKSDVSDSGDKTRKGVLGMKFMRNADKREREENHRLLRDDYAEGTGDANIGRRSYAPGLDESREQLDEAMGAAEAEAEAEAAPSAFNKINKRKGKKRLHPGESEIELRYAEKKREPEAVTQESQQDNPWLELSSVKGKSTYSAQDGNMSSSQAQQLKLKKAKDRATKRGDVQIDVGDTIGSGMVRADQLTLEQQDLVRKAFAGDDVVAEFAAEKEQVVEDEGDKEVDETLPGWGSWGGQGLEPEVRRIKKVAGTDTKKRKDYKRDSVIINEKVNKKLSKYSASAVPFPFENRAQYERSLRMPLGNEWSSKDTFQRQTKPRVIVKKGEVIDPIKRPRHS